MERNTDEIIATSFMYIWLLIKAVNSKKFLMIFFVCLVMCLSSFHGDYVAKFYTGECL